MSMLLHEAMEKLLQQERRSMTAKEIADALNRNQWYTKKDKTSIESGQINLRAKNYPKFFEVDRTTSPIKISLSSKF